jgi:beta-hydroxylase
MLARLLDWRFILLFALIFSAAVVHYRGRVRHAFLRQLSDHSTFFAPYSVLMYAFSAVPSRPFLDVRAFPELAPLAENWRTIREEALQLLDAGQIRAAASYNDAGFNSFFRTGWKRFYLKWYEAPLPSARALCPRTVALLESIPSVTGAMFAMLPQGGRLVRHRDPFAGSLRYHLGLVTPNSERCYISVDGERYHWRDGEAVVFDETYIHYAENQCDQDRIILFCDIERPLRSRAVAALNRWVSRHLVKATTTQNVEGERVGAVNVAFGYLYRVRLLGKRIKQWDRRVYYALKWLLFGGLLYLIFS